MYTLKETLPASGLSFKKNSDMIAGRASLFQISKKGFYLRVDRGELSKSLKNGLTLNPLHAKEVSVHLPDLSLGLEGVARRSRHIGRGVFEIFIEFSGDTPSYWSECLMDILMNYPDERPFTEEFEKLKALKKPD